MNPIIRRELLDLLRTRTATAAMIALAVVCSLLVLVRWPTGGVSDLNGARSLQVLRVFGYGLLAGVLFLVPAFPATSIVWEKVNGTLALLLNSPMSPWSIYIGKLGGVLGFAVVLLAVTTPAAAACHALGGMSAKGGVVLLYAVLAAATIQLTTLGLLVSSRENSSDAALRTTYALVLAVVVLPLAPYWFLQGGSGPEVDLASLVRCLSPVPAVMETLGNTGVGDRGLGTEGDVVPRYLGLSLLTSIGCALMTVSGLGRNPLDRSRPAGVMTQDRSLSGRAARRIFFLVDPQRRSGSINLLFNPVLVKELRTRRFGRSHWVLRLIALCAILSLGLSYIAVSGALAWGSQSVGGVIILLQTFLLILFVPSLASGLISAEREGGTWRLLRMTPLSAGAILRGKLLSVAWPVLLLMCGTLPGYMVMAMVEPDQFVRMQRPLVCLGVTAIFAVLASAVASSLFRSTAAATAAAYLIVVGVCLAPFLIWLGKDSPFGHPTVEAALACSPIAAALGAADFQGFDGYDLLPLNWWITGGVSIFLLFVLALRTRQLCRPE
ncbi:ABC transporter permease [Zavarzinella formosa]|uniref:ABC transporter permease n=1 Tax=Zavarzinella formosa TaxID=360055 RepID=UPI0002F0B5FF|nr:ABC transporter permease subunit [Zavarzinella formosa]